VKRIAPWAIVAGYILLCGLSYGYECEELLQGENPSGVVPVCGEEKSFECTTDTDCQEMCEELARMGFVDLLLCEEENHL